MIILRMLLPILFLIPTCQIPVDDVIILENETVLTVHFLPVYLFPALVKHLPIITDQILYLPHRLLTQTHYCILIWPAVNERTIIKKER